jgi:hypothetical protein
LVADLGLVGCDIPSSVLPRRAYIRDVIEVGDGGISLAVHRRLILEVGDGGISLAVHRRLILEVGVGGISLAVHRRLLVKVGDTGMSLTTRCLLPLGVDVHRLPPLPYCSFRRTLILLIADVLHHDMRRERYLLYVLPSLSSVSSLSEPKRSSVVDGDKSLGTLDVSSIPRRILQDVFGSNT